MRNRLHVWILRRGGACPRPGGREALPCGAHKGAGSRPEGHKALFHGARDGVGAGLAPAQEGTRPSPTAVLFVCALLVGLVSQGCRQDMHDQPKLQPLEASDFFADGMASRPLIEGTVARGQLRADDRFYRGVDEQGDFVAVLPVEVSSDLLLRGRERYDIFCSPCHGRTGDGDGMVVQRGFKAPQSFHQDRLRTSSPGYYFAAMTNGFGDMSSYAAQIPVADRWAIAAYIQALQFSRNADRARLTPADLAVLGGEAPVTEPAAEDTH